MNSTLHALLDGWLFRAPFRGRMARRYTRIERSGFGDLDDRLIRAWHSRLSGGRAVIDIGSGPGVFARRLTVAYPHLRVVSVEPSPAFAADVRAVAERLPFADDRFDVAVCLSSIRHVRDRARALAELARVVRHGGAALVVELDPGASRHQIARHTAPIASAVRRAAFGPLVVRTAPPALSIAELACANGWKTARITRDTLQPVYVVELTHD